MSLIDFFIIFLALHIDEDVPGVNTTSTITTEPVETEPEMKIAPETTVAAAPTLTAEQANAVINQISGMVAAEKAVQ